MLYFGWVGVCSSLEGKVTLQTIIRKSRVIWSKELSLKFCTNLSTRLEPCISNMLFESALLQDGRLYRRDRQLSEDSRATNPLLFISRDV